MIFLHHLLIAPSPHLRFILFANAIEAVASRHGDLFDMKSYPDGYAAADDRDTKTKWRRDFPECADLLEAAVGWAAGPGAGTGTEGIMAMRNWKARIKL